MASIGKPKGSSHGGRRSFRTAFRCLGGLGANRYHSASVECPSGNSQRVSVPLAGREVTDYFSSASRDRHPRGRRRTRHEGC